MIDINLTERINNLPQSDNQSDPHIINARLTYPRSYLYWTQDEDDLLEELYNAHPAKTISILLKRSPNAIVARIKILRNTGDIKARDSVNTVRNAQTTLKNQVNSNNHQPISSNNLNTPPPSSKSNYKKPTGTTEKMLQYWRNSLSDSEKIGFSEKLMRRGEKFTTQQFENAKLDSQKIRRFFEEAEEKIKAKIKNPERKSNTNNIIIHKISVIIAPYTLVKNYEHGKKIGGDKIPTEIFPLWITADLTREGNLIFSENPTSPWIDRRLLTPNESVKESHSFPILGDVLEVDSYYARNPNLFSDNHRQWEELFSFAKNLLFSLPHSEINALHQQNFLLIENGYLYPLSDQFGASKAIIETYDQYIFSESKKIPSLLKKICSLDDIQPAEEISADVLFQASALHLGQVQKEYPLSHSQRTSLSYFSQTKNESIFTVNGPPGTGKTNLLLSIIASTWVKAALQKEFPPIIVASAANNLGILNILDQLKKINTAHWLPNCDDYGIYLASQHKGKHAEENGYLHRTKSDDNYAQVCMQNKDYKKNAQLYFLSQYNAFFEKNETSIKSCQTFIHDIMRQKESFIKKIIDFSHNAYLLSHKISEKYGCISKLDEYLSIAFSKSTTLEKETNHYKALYSDWLLLKTIKLKWLILFSWIPLVKSLLLDHVHLFASKNLDIFSVNILCVRDVDMLFEQKIKLKEDELTEIKKEISILTTEKENFCNLNKIKSSLEQQLGFEIKHEHIFDFSNIENIVCKLDQTLRYDLFVLATHYWEATWLLTDENITLLKKDREGRKKFWQLQAMLTPCFVCTLHSGPAFFSHLAASRDFETLSDFIDLLIIDEAGQATPAIAGAMISTAKKVVLVGDEKQIEPIAKLSEGIDLANAKRYSVCDNTSEYDALKNKGVLCSANFAGHSYGNLIIVGQRKSDYHLKNHPIAGMFLREHRRCAKEIISYCNELCYDNQLLPMTIDQPSDFPRMGYAHVKGQIEKSGTSRINKIEAEAITQWLLKNQSKILRTCNLQNLSDCVAIVTPFSSQSDIIKNALLKNNLKIDKVGTVHSLQGAEKPLIIFSSVYTANDTPGTFFFDRSPNMLNVAVSRAKLSFLVFGDMDIFDPNNSNLPSSLLAKYLFSSEENEICDVYQPKFLRCENEEGFSQIVSLAEHRQALKNSFYNAQYELNIVSPYLSIHAINADNITKLIESCTLRSVIVNIYTDPALNENNLANFSAGIAAINAAGASVYLVNRVHSKIISIDDITLLEGSFNWLGASRSKNFMRDECSISYSGKKVSLFIKKVMEPIFLKAKETVN